MEMVPGSSYAEGKGWENGSLEIKSVRKMKLLLADDTMLVGEYGEMERELGEVKGR